MNSQVVVNINSELKNKAMSMAKAEGLTMKALLSFLLKGYVEEKIEIGAKFTSFERDYGELEIVKLTNEEINFLKNNTRLEEKRKELNLLISQKGI